MIEVVATLQIPRGDEDLWDDKTYRAGVLSDLATAIVVQIKDRITVRRIRNVGTNTMKVEARLLVWERESAVGGRMPETLADVAEAEKGKRERIASAAVPTKKPTIEVAMRVITMPEKAEK